MYTINDHISDNSIEINIKFTFAVYKYTIVYEYIQHCLNADTHQSNWSHIHIIFSSWFYLIIVTSRNSLPNCEHDPSYQEQLSIAKCQREQLSESLLCSSW